MTKGIMFHGSVQIHLKKIEFMIVYSVINPLKEKIIFCIDLSIQFSGTRSEAMSSQVFLKLSKYVWASSELHIS